MACIELIILLDHSFAFIYIAHLPRINKLQNVSLSLRVKNFLRFPMEAGVYKGRK